MHPASSPLANTLLPTSSRRLIGALDFGQYQWEKVVYASTYSWARSSAHIALPFVSNARIERSLEALSSAVHAASNAQI